MADIVNLKRFRKNKARAEKEAEAEQNRVRFGQSKDQRTRQEAEEGIARDKLDAHRIDTDDPGSDDPKPA